VYQDEYFRLGENQHQGCCPCHLATAALGSGARGGEATPHSRARLWFDRGCSRVRFARDSVRRDGEAVTTSRGRVPWPEGDRRRGL